MLTYLNPLSWLAWFREFLLAWAVSLPLGSLPRAIPAVLVIIALAVGLIVARSGIAGWRNDLIGRQFVAAWQADDFPTAELILRRQLAQRPEDADLIYKLAVVRDSLEAKDEAQQLMRQLVGVKRHEQAARWLLSKNFLTESWEKMDETQRVEFGQLLNLVHEKSPQDLAISQLYAEYLIARGNLPKAMGLLEQLAPVQPMRGLQAAAIARQMGNESTADRLASRALEQVDKLAAEDPSNSVLWLAVAQNQLFLKRFPDALKTLERAAGRAKKPEDAAQLRQAVGETLVAWIRFIEESPNVAPQERVRVLKMLQTALEYAPNNPSVLMMVSDHVLATLDDDDESVVSTRNALVAGTSPGISHFIRGTAAMLKDDTETATMHLKIAADLLPRSGAILNNLAVALAAKDGASLEQALKISQTAIAQTAEATPHFYETRGQILVKLERYLEAVPDLERALLVEELAPKAHESLALCYKKLGEDELSRQHDDAAKQ